MPKDAILSILAVVVVVVAAGSSRLVESAIGVNWGTVSLHKLSPTTVVDLLKDNKIEKVKLFDADPESLKALMGSGIEVMVGIPNDLLPLLSSSTAAADLWVSQNVSRYMVKGGANIKYAMSSSFFTLLLPSSHSFLDVFITTSVTILSFFGGRSARFRMIK